MNKWILSLLLFYSISGMACNIDGTGGFAPENNLNISADIKSINGISETVFNEVIDEVSAIYRPIIEASGKPFIVNKKWSNGTVNASAQRDRHGRIIVNMFGGLARHELVTRDGFATVLCHEIGHHIGGAPKRTKWYGSATWASNEGQSDYFATLKCFRRVYGSQDNISFIKNLDIPKIVKTKCNNSFKTETDAALCIRSAMAAKSTTDLLGVLGKTGLTSFDKNDSSIVSKTDDKHPHAQCRLDTYFAASLCDTDMNDEVDDIDPNKGTCNRKDGDSIGLRSLCWFKPNL